MEHRKHKGIKFNHLLIGEMAKLNRVSKQALRMYDRMGLLKPCEKSGVNGYRYYNIEQCATLDIIKYLQEANLSLMEIKIILTQNNPDINSIIDLLNQRYSAIDDEIQEMQLKKIAIERAIISLEDYRYTPVPGTIVVEHLKKRYAFLYKGNDNYYQNPPLYEQGLIEMKEAMSQYNIPYFYTYNPGSVTRKEYLHDEHLYCDELFAYVDKPYIGYNVPLFEIPAGTYLCIYGNDIRSEEQFVHKLVIYADEHDMEIIGDCYEESISDIISIKNDRNNLLMRIQIPVKFIQK